MVTSVSYTCGKKLTKDGKSYGIRKEGRDEACAAKGACIGVGVGFLDLPSPDTNTDSFGLVSLVPTPPLVSTPSLMLAPYVESALP